MTLGQKLAIGAAFVIGCTAIVSPSFLNAQQTGGTGATQARARQAVPAAQPRQWQDWDQGRAFDASATRVAAGQDPIPGPRNCMFRYGPSSGDPYLNIAYPDAATFYWGAAFTIPAGAKLFLEGKFPRARYMSFISYDFRGAPTDAVADYLIEPKAGSTNPFRIGERRDGSRRDYRIEVVTGEPTTPPQWGVYLRGQKRDKIYAPQQGENRQQSILYRIYAGDRGTEETAGAGLPEPVLQMPDGRELRGISACEALRARQPLNVDPAALAVPRPRLRAMIKEAQTRLGPEYPATIPPLWSQTSEDTSRFAIYTGETAPDPGVRRRDGAFYPNLDNRYLRTFINRRLGTVFVLRAKAPTTPKTYSGDAVLGEGQLRYWSWCSNEGYATARVTDCVFDEQIPVGRDGYYTLVVSRPEDRPRNAQLACGVAWLPISKVGDGMDDPDMSLLTLRHMLGTGSFAGAIQSIKSRETMEADMGEYFPRARYTTPQAFETALPCQLEQR
jgi:hypothetical protein